jgi:hypothetical protein
MAIVTFHTKLMEIFGASNKEKVDALVYVNLLNSPVNLGTLRRISANYQNVIDTICTPYGGDTGLANYTDNQLGTSFNLLARIAGIKFLLESVINSINALCAPYAGLDVTNDNEIVQNGVTVIVPDYSPSSTASIKSLIQAIYDNIPE